MEVLQFALLGLGTGALYALMGSGVVTIYRGSGVINFAHAGFAVLGAFLAFELRETQGLPLAAALVAAVLVTAAVGVLVHLLVMRPLRGASPLARVIATLGLLTVLAESVLLKYEAAPRVIQSPLPSDALRLSTDIVVGEQAFWLLGIAVAVTVLLVLLSARTRMGLALSASAENSRAASALGWSPDLLASLTWGVGGGLAGLAGALFPAVSNGLFSVSQIAGLIIGTLATALLAQFRSYPLALAGGLLIGIAQSLSTRYVQQTGFADAVPFLVIVAVLVVRGRGLPVRGTLTDRLPRVGTGRLRPLPIAAAVAAGAGLVLAAQADWQPAITVSLTFAILGLSVVVLTGYAGQLSIAQVALGGAGAFAAGRLVSAREWPMELALLAGVVAAMAVGLVFGLPALRTRGVNLAVVTLGLGFALHQVVFSNTDYTGGEFQTVIAPQTFFGFPVDPIGHPRNLSMLCFLAFVLLALVTANVRRGRSGRRLLAVRANERAAAAAGINVFEAKLYAFVLSSAIAGVGGVLLAFSYPTVLYQQVFQPGASITLLMLSVIGGIGYVLGPLAGSFLAVGGIGTLVTEWEPLEAIAEYLPLITGVALVLTLLANQNGMLPGAQDLARRFGRKRRVPRAADPSAVSTSVAQSVREPIAPRTLEVRALTQRFGGVAALSEVSLTVAPGQVVGLLGPNGAGKTTLIDGVTGYNGVTSGTVLLDGQDITSWSPHRRARAGLTRSFQALELFDDMTVRENLLAASDRPDRTSYLSDVLRPGLTPLPDTAAAAVEELQLTGVLDERPEDLSYGQRRLIAIARAVAGSPSVLLLDEPAAGLDEHETAELGHLIRRLADDWGIAVLLIEHDVPMVLRTADRVVVLDFGRKIADGTPAEVSADPLVRAAYLGEATPEDAEAAAAAQQEQPV
jgi:ABC-type branched-subunit amino acid transport system ATPase component/ABC-type branched-subunit amino acid transport system permease subunit